MGQCGAFLQFLVDMVHSGGGGGGWTPSLPPWDPIPPLPPPLKQRPAPPPPPQPYPFKQNSDPPPIRWVGGLVSQYPKEANLPLHSANAWW